VAAIRSTSSDRNESLNTSNLEKNHRLNSINRRGKYLKKIILKKKKGKKVDLMDK